VSLAICAGVRAVGSVLDRYHALRVKRVVAETADASSLVFDVPAALSDTFCYVAGQFVTLQVEVDGERYWRSYSMSSSPAIDGDLQVTVKRVPGGVVSNWLNDAVREGDVLDVSAPTGVFVLGETDREVVALVGGSGITPVFSIVKSVLHSTAGRSRVLFANHDRGSAIFGDALDDLVSDFPDRLIVEHHEDVVDGFVDASDIAAFVGGTGDAVFYLCGPGAFMDVVETALRGLGVDDGDIHIERFTPAVAESPDLDGPTTDGSETIEVIVTFRNRTKVVAQRGRSTILQSARWAGLRAPSSCEAGHCATCMALVVEGRVEMATNDVLTAAEVDEGWVLTCQAVPVSPVVRVVYEQ
jgi:3-ketosteroid 9alpha-monooxygenase subunit B